MQVRLGQYSRYWPSVVVRDVVLCLNIVCCPQLCLLELFLFYLAIPTVFRSGIDRS
jgi:hypothetical protein